MQIVPQLDAHLSHALSQSCYRWLRLPNLDAIDNKRITVGDLDLTDWIDYLNFRLDCSDAGTDWIQILRGGHGLTLTLAALVFEHIHLATRGGGELVDFYHPRYPPLLRCISDPPNCLTVLGASELLTRVSIGMVGSRKASPFALRESEDLAASLAQAGQVIVSGGAMGCDIRSHIGALRSGERPCPTVVVFAGGLGQLYPRCNDAVFQRLRNNGGVFVSERLWNYPARAYDFPIRNRIIAGCVSRLLLMQAGERSGAKVTAQIALDQGREVYVMTHPEQDVRALGSLQLIRDGAMPFASSQDYLRSESLSQTANWDGFFQAMGKS